MCKSDITPSQSLNLQHLIWQVELIAKTGHPQCLGPASWQLIHVEFNAVHSVISKVQSTERFGTDVNAERREAPLHGSRGYAKRDPRIRNTRHHFSTFYTCQKSPSRRSVDHQNVAIVTVKNTVKRYLSKCQSILKARDLNPTLFPLGINSIRRAAKQDILDFQPRQ